MLDGAAVLDLQAVAYPTSIHDWAGPVALAKPAITGRLSEPRTSRAAPRPGQPVAYRQRCSDER